MECARYRNVFHRNVCHRTACAVPLLILRHSAGSRRGRADGRANGAIAANREKTSVFDVARIGLVDILRILRNGPRRSDSLATQEFRENNHESRFIHRCPKVPTRRLPSRTSSRSNLRDLQEQSTLQGPSGKCQGQASQALETVLLESPFFGLTPFLARF
jgi:hypothetical protein